MLMNNKRTWAFSLVVRHSTSWEAGVNQGLRTDGVEVIRWAVYLAHNSRVLSSGFRGKADLIMGSQVKTKG